MNKEYFECEHGIFGRGKEGVLVDHGGCSVVSMLNGPFEPPGAILDPFKGTLRVHVHSSSEKRSELQMHQAYLEKMFSSVVLLENYPRSLLEVKVYLLSYRNNSLAAIINAISVLLLGSGILSYGVVLGVFFSSKAKSYTAGVLVSEGRRKVVFHSGDAEEREWERDISGLEERVKYSIKCCYKEECKNIPFFLGAGSIQVKQ